RRIRHKCLKYFGNRQLKNFGGRLNFDRQVALCHPSSNMNHGTLHEQAIFCRLQCQYNLFLYFVLQVKYPERPNHQAKYDNSLKQAVLKAVEKHYGEFGMAAFTNSYQFKYSNKETGVYYGGGWGVR
ncbi:hypothetical protein Anas_08958, partial [Armadillidium nasatum]